MADDPPKARRALLNNLRSARCRAGRVSLAKDEVTISSDYRKLRQHVFRRRSVTAVTALRIPTGKQKR